MGISSREYVMKNFDRRIVVNKYLERIARIQNEKKVSLYVRNANLTPSSFYRLVQYKDYLDANIVIRENTPDFLYKIVRDCKNKYAKNIMYLINFIIILVLTFKNFLYDYFKRTDVIVISKTIVPRRMPLIFLKVFNFIVKAKGIKILWDFDDNIKESGEIDNTQFSFLSEICTTIIVTNNELKHTIDEKFQHKVFLLPTTDGSFTKKNYEEYTMDRLKSFDNHFSLVWVGTAVNLGYLNEIIISLDNVAKLFLKRQNKQIYLKIVCNKPLEVQVRYLRIENIMWTREAAEQAILTSHIGLMPLVDNKYTRGKGGFKLVQYLATGLPSIASKVGFNKEVLDDTCGFLLNNVRDNEWEKSVCHLGENSHVWEEYSIGAKKKWDSDFSFENNVNKLNYWIYN
ncbi:glycosyltransferase [Enterococcus sp. DIV1317a]|uniref:glycosyltransferase n=1 Tax=Enterococcus sp. DIV1317a TaxID=2774818 RepID=UPI003F682424